MARERVPPDRVLVACDDVHLPLGKLRLRPDGSAGGHNGLRSIIDCIGQGFPRLRMGVGQEPSGLDRADWVLRRFEKGERDAVDGMLAAAQEVVELVLGEGVEAGRRRAGG
jgi:PTH1 family peptidyl-tRNA hydrolase